MSKAKRTEIVFTYNAKEYKLAYTPLSIQKMELAGFDFAKMGERLLSTPEEIFKGALLAYQPGISDEEAHDIYINLARSESGGDSENDELMAIIGDMLKECVEEIVGRGKKGNVKWTVLK